MSSSSSSSSTSHRWKHDVFTSFRGLDTRKRFMSHLSRELERKEINYFYDKDKENAGMVIEDKIFPAIHHARIALVVFSKRYDTSKWCLNELVEILKCKRDQKLLVLPIFLIKVSEVKKWARQSEFKEALKKLDGEDTEKKQKEWRGALKEASEIHGFDLRNDTNGNEAELINNIVERLVKEIHRIRPLSFVKDAIGVDHFADDVISLLNKGSKKGVRMVGICGPEGIGKTTVAGIAFNRIRGEFEPSLFLTEIGEVNESDRLDQRKDFLKTLGGEECSSLIRPLTNEIKERMRDKKILLVLGGVTDETQVENFGVGKSTTSREMGMGDGSRILITTRNRDLLKALQVDDKYIVNGLSQEIALKLFRRNAFKTEGREQGQEELSKLSKNLTHYAGGHPILLTALGSHVRGKSLDDWRTTLDKLVRRASSLFLPLQSVGLCEGQAGGAGALDHATKAGVRQSSVRIEPVICPSTIDCYKDRCLLHSFEDGELPHGKTVLVTRDFLIECRSRAYPFEVVGPFGDVDGENPWEDKGYTDVREIIVYVGSDPNAIKSISIRYDKCGRPSDLVSHGTTEGSKPHEIKLNYPREYLTAISGYIGEDSRLTILRSLTIVTNLHKYGPYGTMEGKEFSFPYTGGKIVGFHGSHNGSHLESIGAFYKPIPHTFPVKIFGPFGSEGEKFWNFDDIKGIDARYADFIRSIVFEVDNTTSSEPETNYGGNGKQNTFKVKLKNGEYITSFAGYLKNEKGGGTQINSLTFQTNKRMLGPIGIEKGKYFSLPSEAGKVTRFFGRSGDYLKSIGAQVEPFYPFESVGLFGWERGSKWDDGNQHNNVSSIVVELDSSGERFIRSIRFQYINMNNSLPQWETHDGNELPEVSTQEINLDPEEYLTSISGYTWQSESQTRRLKSQTRRLTSLTFQTNKRTLKPIGVEKGKHFSSPTTGGKIVGFYGWSGEHLNAIGAHFQPISHLYPVKSIGPFGGTSGDDWDDGKFDGVREIWVMHNPDIHYIKFLYVKSGEEDSSREHGRRTNGAFAELKKFSLNYPWEYLTSISGYKQEDGAIIQSLTFYTNMRKLGPFGEEKGKYFWYPPTGSRIIGFYGRCGDKLNAIGVYAEPVPQLYPFKTIGPFGGSGGTLWDDGVHTDVRGFLISFGDAIHSIGIVYDNNGSIVERSIHGRGDGPRPHSPCMEFWLDYPKERLVSMKGWMDASGSTSPIRNLRIVTTKTTHGPFMPKSWPKQDDWKKLKAALSKLEEFKIPAALDGGRIVGFFGRAGPHLVSIGARLESY